MPVTHCNFFVFVPRAFSWTVLVVLLV